MFFFYRIIINIIFILSPIIIAIRILRQKESFYRFKEKFCLNSKKRLSGKLIWFHGASVGEIKSVLPLIEKKCKSNFDYIKYLKFFKNITKSKVKKNCSPIFSDRYNFLMQKIFKLLETIFSFFYRLGDLA